MAEYFESGTQVVDPVSAVTACIEAGRRALLLDAPALPAAFFDLSTGSAGAFVQRLRNYGICAALVVPDRTRHSRRFQEFAAEADRGEQLRFMDSRAEAVQWLSALEE